MKSLRRLPDTARNAHECFSGMPYTTSICRRLRYRCRNDIVCSVASRAKACRESQRCRFVQPLSPPYVIAHHAVAGTGDMK